MKEKTTQTLSLPSMTATVVGVSTDMLLRSYIDLPYEGKMVSQFASQNVQKRLVGEETYREKQYEPALKRAFLGTDEDLLAGKSRIFPQYDPVL